MITTEQQTGLANWKQDQSQPLPASLQNIFIEDCLEELNSKNTIDRFNSVSEGKNDYILAHCPDPIYEEKNGKQYDSKYKFVIFYFDYDYDSYCPPYREYTDNQDNYCTWEKFHWSGMTSFVQTLLSRTPNGQAVMPFLDVETQEYEEAKSMSETALKNKNYISLIQMNTVCQYTPQTFDHLLYQKFTEALRVGKTFDEALEIITKIYILNIYV